MNNRIERALWRLVQDANSIVSRYRYGEIVIVVARQQQASKQLSDFYEALKESIDHPNPRPD